MPSKPKTPALDRLVRQAMRRAERLDGAWVVIYTRKQLRELIQAVAGECARIAERGDPQVNYSYLRATRAGGWQDAAKMIREQFRIEEGEDA